MNSSSNTEGTAHQAWLLMCDKQQFTRREIADALAVNPNLITKLTQRLQKQSAIGLLTSKSGNSGNVYQVLVAQDAVILGAGRPQTPRAPQVKTGTVVQQIWNSIRINRQFTKNLILATSTAPAAKVSSYVGCLVKAGYVRVLNSRKGNPRQTCLRYMLVRDTGRLHPTERPDGMWDPNTQTFYPYLVKSLRGCHGANQGAKQGANQ